MPTFDEWFLDKYEQSFDDKYMQEGMWIHEAMKAHLDHGREYLSYIATQLQNK
jgi:hypothetical protein